MGRFFFCTVFGVTSMKVYEIDWRHSSIEAIFDAVSVALANISRSFAPEDVDEASDQAESFLGIAFVAAQAYIYGSLQDARKLAKSTGKPKRKPEDLLKKFSSVVSGTRITEIQVCDEIANYFKHEWPYWSERSKRHGKALGALNAVGITESTAYPCQEAAKKLWGYSSTDLKPLLLMIASWREQIIADSK